MADLRTSVFKLDVVHPIDNYKSRSSPANANYLEMDFAPGHS